MMSESDKKITQMFGIYLVFGGWLGMFVLGFFVNEVFTNYSLCKKDKIEYNTKSQYNSGKKEKFDMLNVKPIRSNGQN